jgi:DNA polymerase-3 subunit gamma/tau
MTQALYRKYRSKTLEEVIGQDHVTSVLQRALASQTYGHAYLFTGPRGTGKTSIARILAHEINQLPYDGEVSHMDIIEIDAASNNGVDDVRELRDKALIAPSSAAKKVYIIDEVHMLSKSAFNALLKILEEPPAHVVFILATTDFDKLPDTIISRTQRYHFHMVEPATVVTHLSKVAAAERIEIERPALEIIAQRGGGSVRDSMTLLDQIRNSAAGAIKATDVEQALGLATSDQVSTLLQAMLARSASDTIQLLRQIGQSGISAVTLASQLAYEIQCQLAEHPELVHYLEGLHDVSRAAQPMIKLIVTVVAPSSAPMSVPVAQTPQIPQTSPAVKPATRPTPVFTPEPSTGASVTSQSPSSTTEPAISATDQTLDTTHTPANLKDFNWQTLLEYAREHKAQFFGLHTILAKCTPEVRGDTLVLYTGTKFAKTKLDTAKNRATIGKILREIGAGDATIETVGSSPPPKDEHAAKIAAMMGGGEEVDVNEGN